MKRTKAQSDSGWKIILLSHVSVDILNQFSFYSYVMYGCVVLTASKNLNGRTSSVEKE